MCVRCGHSCCLNVSRQQGQLEIGKETVEQATISYRGRSASLQGEVKQGFKGYAEETEPSDRTPE